MKLTLQVWCVIAAVVAAVAGCRRMPEPPVVAVREANAAMADKIETAYRALKSALNSADAWGRYGEVLHAAEYLDAARTCYLEALNRAPDSARWSHLLGLVQLQDDPINALKNLRKAADLSGRTNDAPTLKLAQALVERGDFAEATNRLYKLLAVKPDHAAARLELARVDLRAGDWKSAESWLAPCRTNPYTARNAWILLSQTRARAGDAAAAGEFARRAAAMPRGYDWPDPYLKEVQALRDDAAKLAERVNQLLQQRRLDDAEVTVSNLTTRFPSDAEGILLTGRLRLQQRRCPEAERQCRAYLERVPEGLNGLIQLALAQMCQENWRDAAATLERAIAVKSDFAQAHYNLGSVRIRLGDSEKAIESFREAARCNPGDAAAFAALAEAQEVAGKRQEAMESADRALQLDRGNARALGVKARISGSSH